MVHLVRKRIQERSSSIQMSLFIKVMGTQIQELRLEYARCLHIAICLLKVLEFEESHTE